MTNSKTEEDKEEEIPAPTKDAEARPGLAAANRTVVIVDHGDDDQPEEEKVPFHQHPTFWPIVILVCVMIVVPIVVGVSVATRSSDPPSFAVNATEPPSPESAPSLRGFL